MVYRFDVRLVDGQKEGVDVRRVGVFTLDGMVTHYLVNHNV